MGFSDVCPQCGGPISCLAGESAHPDNWYCDDKKCGWRGWSNDRNRKPVVAVEPSIPDGYVLADESAMEEFFNYFRKIAKRNKLSAGTVLLTTNEWNTLVVLGNGVLRSIKQQDKT